jgi:hypothetical protein
MRDHGPLCEDIGLHNRIHETGAQGAGTALRSDVRERWAFLQRRVRRVRSDLVFR